MARLAAVVAVSLAWALLPGPVHAQQAHVPQGTVQAREAWGCPSVGGWDHQRQLAREPDTQAWLSFMERVGCQLVEPHTPVRVAPVPGQDRQDVVCLFYAGDRPAQEGWSGCLVVGQGGVRVQ